MARRLLYLLTAFAIGRVQELFAFLEPLRVVLLVGGACALSALLTPAVQRRPVLQRREVRIVLGMVALAIMMLPFSVWPGGSLRFLIENYSKVVILFLLVVALATDNRVIRNLVWAVLIGVGLLGVFTLAGASRVTSDEYAIARTAASSTYDANDVAMMMVTTLPIAALGAAALRGWGRLGAAGIAIVCVLGTIKTVSRGGFIGLAFVTLALLFRMRSAGARLLAGAAIVGVLVVATPGAYWDVMGTIWNPTGTGYVERGISPRVDLWTRGLALLLRNPLTGVGVGMYETATGFSYGRRGGWVTAHNSFLQVATELGIIGLALFLTLLAVSIGNARRVVRAAREDPRLHDLAWIASAVEISLYVFMVVGFALSQAYAAMLYFLVGLAAALRVEAEIRQRTPTIVDVARGEPSERVIVTV